MKKENFDDWIDMDTTPPELGQKIMYWFKYTGVSVGFYNGKHEEYGWNQVSGKSGFLGEDGMMWRPLTDEEFDRLEAKERDFKEVFKRFKLKDLTGSTN